MKYRLDEKHYVDDMLLEAGTEVGDDTGYPWRYERDTMTKDKEGKPYLIKAGQPRPPSVSMTPLDDEAKNLFERHFGTQAPERDPTKPIPVMGNVKQEGMAQPRPTAQQTQQRTAAGEQPHNPKPVTLGSAGATPQSPKPALDPKKVGVPGEPDNHPVTRGGPQNQSAPPSPAPSGPGSGKTEEEARREGNPNPNADTGKKG